MLNVHNIYQNRAFTDSRLKVVVYSVIWGTLIKSRRKITYTDEIMIKGEKSLIDLRKEFLRTKK